MKILITGAKGQLGSDLRAISGNYPAYDFIYTDLPELDITYAEKVEDYFKVTRPDVLINCAAYTAVDKAESDPGTANLINTNAAGILAEASAKYGTFLIHISSDYVFDGSSSRPLVETDNLNPISMYAHSKLGGEKLVQQYAQNAMIIRTSWLYSSFGHNFVKTILKYAKEKDSMNIVYDQIGTPTYARDLAKTILDILPKAIKEKGVEIYHYSNEGVASWYDFAIAILEMSNLHCILHPITTIDYPSPAARPLYSVLNKTKIKKHFNIEIPYWRDSLKDCLQLINP